MTRAGYLFALALILVGRGCGPNSKSDDLNINLECDNIPSGAAIEGFLKEQGFQTADEDRVRRQYGRGSYPMIEGIDSQKRWISFAGMSVPPQAYFNVSLDGPPPTRHDKVLEQRLITFVSHLPGCKINSRTFGNSEENTAALYSQFFADALSRIKEARTCDQAGPNFDAAACRKIREIQ